MAVPVIVESAAEDSAAANPAPAKKSFRDLVTDDEDGRFDVSEIARILGMRAGLDFAWSSEGDHTFYIIVGNPWR